MTCHQTCLLCVQAAAKVAPLLLLLPWRAGRGWAGAAGAACLAEGGAVHLAAASFRGEGPLAAASNHGSGCASTEWLKLQWAAAQTQWQEA